MTRLRPLLLAAFTALPLGAADAQTTLTGYTAARAEAQLRAERAAMDRITPATIGAHAVALSREAHVAGTPAQARTRDYVINQMRSWGLETEVRTYDVWLPHATSARVWVLGAAPRELSLREPAVPGDPTSALPQYPTVNGYSGVGDVSAEIVYVNYGLIEDYAQLDSMGVSVRGKIAVARYGRSFRGIKAREAERRGAVALILYSDPADDGYVRGDVYPEGPMRPPAGVQRGSVMNGNGDPTTPGYASVPGAPRVPIENTSVPRIPVVPVGYANAAELLRGVRGSAVPQSWQGGLAFRYHAGPGPVRARVQVRDDRATRAVKPIHNTFGIIRGTDYPDELVIVGAHRDAWSPGAADNVSGTASVLEAARAIAERARAGERPRRTIVFATWDAEEWGLIGSSEYVEDDSLRLGRYAIAYLNQDVSASGPSFGAGGSPSLRSALRDVVRTVPHPGGTGTVYDAWRAGANVAPGTEPAMGDPGGGSDFAGFYNHLGIPHADWGFGGPGGVYHSHYDSRTWMQRFGDPDYRYHATAARINVAMLLRLANADVVPFDYVEHARTMRSYLPAIGTAATARGWGDVAAPLAAAIGRFEAAAAEVAPARDRALVSGNAATLVEANAALREVERALTRPEGLRSRPWFRNLIYAADENNGYSTMALPSVNEAMRRGDRALAVSEIADLSRRFDDAADRLRRAAALLAR